MEQEALRQELKETQDKLAAEQEAANNAAWKALEGMDQAEAAMDEVSAAADEKIAALQGQLDEANQAEFMTLYRDLKPGMHSFFCRDLRRQSMR